MRKNIFLLIFVATILLSSCAASKKQVETISKSATENTNTSISDEEKNEFEYTFIEALKQKMIGNSQAAITLFSKCLEINPNSSSAMFELAKIHSGTGDQTSSSLLLEKAIEIEPENKWYKILLAQIFQQSKQYNKAANIYTQLSKQEPENQEYIYLKAALLASSGKIEQAIAAYNELEKKVGINDQISVEKHELYLAAGKKKEALAELQKLIDYNPAEPRYYGLMADYYQSEKDDVNALKYYNKILEIEPDNGFVLFSLGSFYQEKGDTTKAWEYIRKGFHNNSIEVESKIQFYLMITANQEKQLLNEEQIKELVEIMAKNNPDDYRVKTVKAEYLIRSGKLAESRDIIREILENNKDNYMFWERLLMISNDLQDWNSLNNEAVKAIELFPNQAVLYALKGVACLQLEKYEDAINILKQGEQYVLENKLLQIQFDLYIAEANYKLDRVSEAFIAFEKVIKQDPENWMAMNNYAYYLSIRNENLERAEILSSKAVRANPNNPTYLDTYAWVLFMRKDYSLAKFYMESALKNGGDKNGVIVEHYGDILIMLGQKESAIEYWKKANELGEVSQFINEKIKQGRYIDK